jgi:hypothetical protein
LISSICCHNEFKNISLDSPYGITTFASIFSNILIALLVHGIINTSTSQKKDNISSLISKESEINIVKILESTINL